MNKQMLDGKWVRAVSGSHGELLGSSRLRALIGLETKGASRRTCSPDAPGRSQDSQCRAARRDALRRDGRRVRVWGAVRGLLHPDGEMRGRGMGGLSDRSGPAACAGARPQQHGERDGTEKFAPWQGVDPVTRCQEGRLQVSSECRASGMR